MSGTIFLPEETNESQTIEEMEDELFNQRLIYQMLIKISKDPTVPDNIRSKVHETIMFANIQQVSNINTPEGSPKTILGLKGLQSPDFTHEEQSMVVKLVDERLLDYLKELQDNQPRKEEDVYISDEILFESRENLQKTMKSYATNLLEYQKLLEQVQDFQAKKLPEICTGKEKETKMLLKMNESQVKLMEHSVQIQICTENEVCLDAYKQLLESIKSEKAQYEMGIQQLKELKVKYKLADSKEYREVLKEYVDYQTAIEKIHRMQQLINNKS
ncbi:uncharacterized protein [Atheta coriaria]|uniref:uncharacterized protein n=1 Tax=Dalotia coriaria TaxID=877792 RepID=UPI0031F43925